MLSQGEDTAQSRVMQMEGGARGVVRGTYQFQWLSVAAGKCRTDHGERTEGSGTESQSERGYVRPAGQLAVQHKVPEIQVPGEIVRTAVCI